MPPHATLSASATFSTASLSTASLAAASLAAASLAAVVLVVLVASTSSSPPLVLAADALAPRRRRPRYG